MVLIFTMLPDVNNLLKPRARKFRNIAKHLSHQLALTNRDSISFANDDIFTDLSKSRGTNRFLGYFSQKGIEFGINAFGIFDQLSKSGLPVGTIHINTDDPFKHVLQLQHSVNNTKIISIEVVMRRGSFKIIPEIKIDKQRHEFVIVEWFLAQNPFKSFTKKRPQLPGQEHPGLGVSELIFEMFYWMARRFGSDGVLLVPNYLHTGLFYGRQCLFLNPVRQGENYVLSRAASKKSLDQLSWACTEGQLVHKKNKEVYFWKPEPLVLPVSKRLKDYFHSHAYANTVRQTRKSFAVKINPGYKKQYSPQWTTHTVK